MGKRVLLRLVFQTQRTSLLRLLYLMAFVPIHPTEIPQQKKAEMVEQKRWQQAFICCAHEIGNQLFLCN